MAISNEIKTLVLTQALPYIQRYKDKVVVVNCSVDPGEIAAVMEAFVSDIVLLGSIGVKVVLVQGADVKNTLCLCGAIDKSGGKAVFLHKADKENIEQMLSLGYIPIVSVSEHGADMAAARVAWELKAENLIVPAPAPGIFDPADRNSLVSELSVSDVPYFVKQGAILGNMIETVDACVEAVRRGVKKACIIDGRIAHSILIEMFSDEGIGTLFVSE